MAAVMNEQQAGQSVLQSVAVSATLRNLLSEVSVTQVYVNREEQNIEAVYTIPLPMDAVLLELTVKLGDETLTGVVKGRAAATRDYEKAVTNGDAAVLLEHAGDGLYTVNVGNLLPGETAEVMFRYAQLHQWQGDVLRFYLQTTVAPRYGDPFAAGLQHHQVPGVSIAADNRFSFSLQVSGELAGSAFASPSHKLVSVSTGDTLTLRLKEETADMDRDLVINFARPEMSQASRQVLLGKDGERSVALASFNLRGVSESHSELPACFKIVVDCSGSMTGDSIEQARKAIAGILDRLQPGDYFNITRFGSTHRMLFKSAKKASNKQIDKARQWLEMLDADMGGTEIEEALRATVRAGGIEGLANNILLITDGEVYAHDHIIDSFAGRMHRIFTIGVGSAVSENFVRQLAMATGGASELVSPRENMATRIVNQFERMRQPAVKNLQLRWPAHATETSDLDAGAVFLNDTLHVFGWFDEGLLDKRGAGEVKLSFSLGDEAVTQTMQMPASVDIQEGERDELARLAIAQKIKTFDDERQAAELAEQYQLVTEYSSCVLVKQRAEDAKADTIPALRKVDHMMAAGSHGFGTVMESVDCCASYSSSADVFDDSVKFCLRAESTPPRRLFSKAPVDGDRGFMDIPAFLRRHVALPEWQETLISNLNSRHTAVVSTKLKVLDFGKLTQAGIDYTLLTQLRAFKDTHDLDEDQVVILFLYVFIDMVHGKSASRTLRRVVTRAWSELPGEVKSLEDEMLELLDE